MTGYPFADLSLARRLERAEAEGCARFVEARSRLFLDCGAAWIDVAGTYATFDGPSSPLTQTFAFGLFAPPTAENLIELERFFRHRAAPVFHEVCPLADLAHATLLAERGYHPFEFTSVLYRPIGPATQAVGDSPSVLSEAPTRRPFDKLRVVTSNAEGRPAQGERRVEGGIGVRIIDESEQDLWSATAAAGWSGTPELGEFMLGVARVHADRTDTRLFLAEQDGRAIATGALSLADGVAVLAGASTIPDGRGRGAQLALLASRLSYAAEQGCDLAMMCALPGSGSQRNAERHGFSIAYTRTKWRLL